ncbi:helix-turn-helix domain protein [Candidatus Desulforudis audaxviator MP104C]|uniref:Helix-turn-helix domain protein n=1 Tax=Desulforudis audaxviator (strain MP104C) TaxID=477974 RepID=B1I2S9_DESAP|nr:helix-turn-helix transcriptional regulator [Candidatus Desulforudis audaxviator]ACA59298.1 helix-turn-helix domain protein [Candidatus Desulforudis audaxviator MP104C]
MNRFGETLKRLRHRMGLRQNDVAGMLGVERSTVANWERGVKQPSLDTLIKLSETFGVSLDELVGAAQPTAPLPPAYYQVLASDPLVVLLAKRTSVPAKTIAAFIAAFQIPESNCGKCRQSKKL